MFKKYSILLLLFISLAFSKDIQLTKTEQQWIKTHTIKVGVSPWYPITYYDKRKHEIGGVGIDILNLIIKRLNLKVQYIPNRWNKLLEDFKNNKIDLLPTTYYTKQRANFGNYTTPYMYIKELLYVRKNSNIKGFKDLEGKKIAIVKKYGTIEKIKQNFPKIKIVEVDTLAQTVKMLLDKKVDAIFNTQFSIETFLTTNFITGLKAIFQTDFKPSPLHYFTTKTKPILQTIMQKGVDSLSEYEKNSIIAKWLNTQERSTEKIFLTKDDKKYLKKLKVIKMCNNPNWEPIEFLDENNNLKGIAIDYIKILEKQLNIKFQTVPTKSWVESQQFLKEKKCDILPCAIKTKKRSKYAIFTEPYLSYKLAIITNKDTFLVNSLRDLDGKTMSRKKGSGLIDKVKALYPKIKIKETTGYLDSLRRVESGEVDFTISTLPAASYYINKFALYNLHIAGYTNINYNLSIAVRDDKPQLKNILNRALKTIPQETKKDIEEKWSKVHISEASIDYKMIANILIILFIIGIFIFYRQYILKKANKDLKKIVDEKTAQLKEINENLEHRIVQEVQKSKEMEQIVFKSEKLAAMGEMIGNIAHQWRQPLSTISTIASGTLIEQEYGLLTKEKLKNHMDKILQSTDYLSNTINDFRNLIKGSTNKEIVLLWDLIQKALSIVQPTLNSNYIKLEEDIDKTIQVKLCPNLLIQTILNIINNAKDALKEHNIENKTIFIKVYQKDTYAYIDIYDNAGGIAENILDRVFEPYFTTKHQTQGTGLGLHMVYKIVTENLEGTIDVNNIEFEYKNTNYKGALFRIILPLN